MKVEPAPVILAIDHGGLCSGGGSENQIGAAEVEVLIAHANIGSRRNDDRISIDDCVEPALNGRIVRRHIDRMGLSASAEDE
jgi:hypothetical protein